MKHDELCNSLSSVAVTDGPPPMAFGRVLVMDSAILWRSGEHSTSWLSYKIETYKTFCRYALSVPIGGVKLV